MNDNGMWYVLNGVERRRGRSDRLVTPPPTSRFPGDPGTGKMFHGLSLDLTQTSISDFESSTGTNLGIYRRYYSNRSMADISPFTSNLSTDLASDRITWASFKLPGASSTGWTETINGDNDGWLSAIANAINNMAPHPVWIAFHHEPRGDGPAADFVAMFEHAIAIIKPIASNAAIGPILNGYSFASPGGDPDPHVWYVPSADKIDFDQYNQWWTYDTTLKVGQFGSAESYHPWSLPSQVFSPLDIIQSWGKPCAIAEYGVHYPWQEVGKAQQWMADAYNYALSHGALAMTYFNSGLNSPRGEWNMDKYNKPPDWSVYSNSERLNQFISDNHRPESISASQALS